MTQRTCTLPDCTKPARSALADWCKMHYHRWYRHGSVEKVSVGVRTGSPRRYRTVTAKGHPLAGKNGRAYEHRVVLYDQIGPGPHECHWCSALVEWAPKGTPGELQPDHINNDGGDNRPENLVPSCRGCNTARAKQYRSEVLREMGFWSHNDTVAGLSTPGRRDRIDDSKELQEAS